MAEKKEYFWNEFNPKWEEVFQMELLEYKDKMDLLSFYSAMADLIRSKGVNIKEVEDDYIEKQTLSFLYPLLKNGELVMLLIGFEEKKREDGVCCQKESYISTKENAEKIIKRLEELWLAEDECNGKGIESLTLFTLPENKDILLYWNPTKEIKLKEDWEKIKKGK